jgi:anti-sigma B factor antagonist
MTLRISERQDHHVTIADLHGRLTLGPDVQTFRNYIELQARRIAPNLLLNLGGVSYIDSSGLGELTAASCLISGAGGTIKLLNVNRRVSDLLSVTKLYTVFETFEDEDRALLSFPGSLSAPASMLGDYFVG